jgi:hypothetical protein
VTPEEFFADHPIGLTVLRWALHELADLGPLTVRVSKSQVALRRRKGFAYLWLPGRYLKRPRSELVLSIALPDQVDSARFKQVVHPAQHVWMHHLEIGGVDVLDAEAASWLRAAYEHAA